MLSLRKSKELVCHELHFLLPDHQIFANNRTTSSSSSRHRLAVLVEVGAVTKSHGFRPRQRQDAAQDEPRRRETGNGEDVAARMLFGGLALRKTIKLQKNTCHLTLGV